jgi:tetratricopeptide (TPR) repeat protein
VTEDTLSRDPYWREAMLMEQAIAKQQVQPQSQSPLEPQPEPEPVHSTPEKIAPAVDAHVAPTVSPVTEDTLSRDPYWREAMLMEQAISKQKTETLSMPPELRLELSPDMEAVVAAESPRVRMVEADESKPELGPDVQTVATDALKTDSLDLQTGANQHKFDPSAVPPPSPPQSISSAPSSAGSTEPELHPVQPFRSTSSESIDAEFCRTLEILQPDTSSPIPPFEEKRTLLDSFRHKLALLHDDHMWHAAEADSARQDAEKAIRARSEMEETVSTLSDRHEARLEEVLEAERSAAADRLTAMQIETQARVAELQAAVSKSAALHEQYESELRDERARHAAHSSTAAQLSQALDTTQAQLVTAQQEAETRVAAKLKAKYEEQLRAVRAQHEAERAATASADADATERDHSAAAAAELATAQLRGQMEETQRQAEERAAAKQRALEQKVAALEAEKEREGASLKQQAAAATAAELDAAQQAHAGQLSALEEALHASFQAKLQAQEAKAAQDAQAAADAARLQQLEANAALQAEYRREVEALKLRNQSEAQAQAADVVVASAAAGKAAQSVVEAYKGEQEQRTAEMATMLEEKLASMLATHADRNANELAQLRDHQQAKHSELTEQSLSHTDQQQKEVASLKEVLASQEQRLEEQGSQHEVVLAEVSVLRQKHEQAEQLRLVAEEKAADLACNLSPVQAVNSPGTTSPRWVATPGPGPGGIPMSRAELDAEYEQVKSMLLSPTSHLSLDDAINARPSQLDYSEVLSVERAPTLAAAHESLRAESSFNIDILKQRGKSFYASKDYGQAAACFNSAVQLDARDEEARAGLASSNSMLRHEAVLSPLQDRTSATSESGVSVSAEALRQAAQAHFAKKEYKSCIELFEQAIKADPDSVQAHQGLSIARATRARVVQKCRELGENFLAKQEYDHAIIHFEMALEHDPTDLRSQEALRMAYSSTSGIVQEGDGVERLRLLGETAFAAQDPLEAVRHFKAALQMDPSNVEVQEGLEVAKHDCSKRVAALVQKGRQHEGAQEWGPAIAAFEGALRLDPDNDELHEKLSAVERQRRESIGQLRVDAEVFLGAGEYLKAVEYYQAALVHDPLSTQLQSGLSAALDARDKVVQKSRMLGEGCLAAQEYKEAVAHFELALRYQPHEHALQEALRSAQHGLSLASARTDAAVRACLEAGQRAFVARQYQAALDSFGQALQLHSGHPQVEESIKVVQHTMQQEVQQLAQRAAEALMRQRFDDAAGDLRAAMLLDPHAQGLAQQLEQVEVAQAEAVRSCRDVGNAAVRALDFVGAVEHFSAALKCAPDNAEVLADLSLVESMHRDAFEKRKRAGDEAVEVFNYAEAAQHYTTAVALGTPGDEGTVADTTEALHRVEALIKRQTVQLQHEADEHSKKHQYYQAVGLLEQALSLRPSDEEIQHSLQLARKTRTIFLSKQEASGDAALSAERFNEASTFFAMALKLDPTSSRLHEKISKAQLLRTEAKQRECAAAESSLARQDFGDAVAHYVAALRHDPTDEGPLQQAISFATDMQARQVAVTAESTEAAALADTICRAAAEQAVVISSAKSPLSLQSSVVRPLYDLQPRHDYSPTHGWSPSIGSPSRIWDGSPPMTQDNGSPLGSARSGSRLKELQKAYGLDHAPQEAMANDTDESSDAEDSENAGAERQSIIHGKAVSRPADCEPESGPEVELNRHTSGQSGPKPEPDDDLGREMEPQPEHESLPEPELQPMPALAPEPEPEPEPGAVKSELLIEEGVPTAVKSETATAAGQGSDTKHQQPIDVEGEQPATAVEATTVEAVEETYNGVVETQPLTSVGERLRNSFDPTAFLESDDSSNIDDGSVDMQLSSFPSASSSSESSLATECLDQDSIGTIS